MAQEIWKTAGYTDMRNHTGIMRSCAINTNRDPMHVGPHILTLDRLKFQTLNRQGPMQLGLKKIQSETLVKMSVWSLAVFPSVPLPQCLSSLVAL